MRRARDYSTTLVVLCHRDALGTERVLRELRMVVEGGRVLRELICTILWYVVKPLLYTTCPIERMFVAMSIDTHQ
jgi:hypothetical protein